MGSANQHKYFQRSSDRYQVCPEGGVYHLLGLKQIIGFSVFSLGFIRCERCVIRVRTRKGDCLWRRPAVSVKSVFFDVVFAEETSVVAVC